MNFCSAENYTTSLHKQGRDLCVHSIFHIFLERRRFWPVPSGGWGRVIPSISTRGRVSSKKKMLMQIIFLIFPMGRNPRYFQCEEILHIFNRKRGATHPKHTSHASLSTTFQFAQSRAARFHLAELRPTSTFIYINEIILYKWNNFKFNFHLYKCRPAGRPAGPRFH